jgi:integrase/recombinase XerD
VPVQSTGFDMKLQILKQEHELLSFQVHGFLSYCKSKNLSQVTIEGYESILRDFERFLSNKDILKITQISQSVIAEYLLSLTEKEIINQATGKVMRVGLSSYARRNRFAAIRVFFNYLVEYGYVTENPVQKLKSPRLEKKLIQTFSIDQLSKLLSMPNQKMLYGYRDYAIMLTLLDTGMRVSELINLRIEDIDWTENMFLIVGKGRKERTVPFSSRLKRVLWKYLEKRRHIENDYLFLDIYEEKMTRHAVQQMIFKYGQRARITKVRVSPHTFRHTFAKMWILNGGDTFSLQKILGHTSMDMVRNYVNLASSDVLMQHRKFSPLDRMGI